MEQFLIVILFIALIFFWIDLREARRIIRRLRKHQESMNERLAQIEQQSSPVTHHSYSSIPQLTTQKATPKTVKQETVSDEQDKLVKQLLAKAQDKKHQAQKRREQTVASLSGSPDSDAVVTMTQRATQSVTQPLPEAQEEPVAQTSVQTPVQARQPHLIDKGISHAKNWLTTGNIPVKIGMLVLFAAVIAFLRYATTQGWLRLPMEYRLTGIAAAAIGALIFAWRKRNDKRSFSLTVQGGSIGILLLVTFAAVKMYAFISPTAGLIVSVGMVMLAAALALQQDAKPLVIMAVFAGFLAPIWLSDGTGSHIVLFSYYAILNVGIFWVAWQKPWRELNLLGFVFTYVIGSTWGGLRYSEANFATTEPFVVLFFCFYLLIPLRYANRQHADEASGSVSRYAGKTDAALLFGTPLVTLGLQAGMLQNNSDRLALSCVTMGAIYGVLVWLLRGKTAYETLRQAYVGLSAGFFTLAVPIGLSAKATTVIFALEGAGAMWLGLRERRTLTWLSGGLLQIAAAIGFAVAFRDYRYFSAEYSPLLNDFYLSALLMTLCAGICLWVNYRFASRGLHEPEVDPKSKSKSESKLNAWLTIDKLYASAQGFFFWGMAWWLGAALCEMLRYPPISYNYWLFITLTAATLVIVRRYYTETPVIITQSLLLLSGGVITLLCLQGAILSHHSLEQTMKLSMNEFYPLSTWEGLAWSAYAVAGRWIWHDLRDNDNTLVDAALVTWILSLASIISVGVYQILPATWSDTGLYWWAISAVWLLLAWLITVRPTALRYLAQRPSKRWQSAVSSVVMGVITVSFVGVGILSGGDSRWWLPILNTTDTLQWLIAALLLLWMSRYQPRWLNLFGAVISVGVFIAVTLRMTHHWGGFSVWNPQQQATHWNDWLHLATFGFWLVLWWIAKQWLSPKLQAASSLWLPALQTAINCLLLLLGGVWVALLFVGGDVGSMPWLPLFNPLAILQGTILATVWWWFKDRKDQAQGNNKPFVMPCHGMIMPALVLVLISVMTLRFVHHYAEISWGASLFTFSVTQMALTLIWSILGVLTWIIGSRRESRPLWLSGALLMSVVLVKLVLIDRGHLGNLFGILSFFAYGMLCVIVGYFAPMPPAEITPEKTTPAEP